MARWEPDPRDRLVRAAIDLFTEQGYDETTVAQIAQRAGLTKSTFFRHFSDKREVLAAGQDVLSTLLADGVAGAPADATPLQAVAAALDSMSEVFTPQRRELAPRIKAAIDANSELQARDAMKQIGLATAISDALKARGVAAVSASLAAEMGSLAIKLGFERWTQDQSGECDFGFYARQALAELQSASASLS